MALVRIEIEAGDISNAPSNALATVSDGSVTVSGSASSGGHVPTGFTISGSTDGGPASTAVDRLDASVTTDILSNLNPSMS